MELEKAKQVVEGLIDMKASNMAAQRTTARETGVVDAHPDVDDCDIEVHQALTVAKEAIEEKIDKKNRKWFGLRPGPSETRPKRPRERR